MVQVYIVYIETSGDVVYTVFLHHNWLAKVIQDIVRPGKFGMTPFTEGPCSPSVTFSIYKACVEADIWPVLYAMPLHE